MTAVSEITAYGSSLHEILRPKQQLLSRVALIFALILMVFTALIFFILPGIKPGKIIAILTTVLFAVISWCSLKPKLYTPSAIAMVILTLTAGFAGSLTNGGLEGYVAPIMLTAPIAAALFLGTRATLISAVAVILAFSSLLIIEPLGLVQPEPYPSGVTSIAALVLLSTATAFCSAGLGYFAYDAEDKIRTLILTQGELVEAANKLQHAAHYDALTGAANRQKLHEHLQAIASDEASSDTQICLIQIDLDKFKEVNDTYGHPIGDGVLREAVHRMKNLCGGTDLVARVGGDEFVIVTRKKPSEHVQEIQNFSEGIIDQISRPMLINGIECHLSASIGYVVSDMACSSMETLMANADIALYESKRCGRGIARQFIGSMRESIELRYSFVSDLKFAFQEDRITCALQPQICVRSGALLSLEALGRIRTKTGALIAPEKFLHILEDISLIDTFDELVMGKALDALVSIRNQGFDVPSVSVNASAKSLRSTNYITKVQRALSARNLSQEDVVVEVLESILIEDRDDMAAKTIEKLSDFGVKTVMDDFGSGHACIASLLELDLAGIKVDRSLVSNIECERSQTVVEAVLSLSKGLNLTAVVEGVETQRQFSILQSLGCDAAQGFGICKPLAVGELAEWLEGFGRSDVTRLQNHIRQSVTIRDTGPYAPLNLAESLKTP